MFCFTHSTVDVNIIILFYPHHYIDPQVMVETSLLALVHLAKST